MRAHASLFIIFCFAACARNAPPNETVQQAATGGIEPGSAFAKGVLRVVNELSDDDLLSLAGLDPTAAKNIVYYRTGDDRAVGTDDDEMFDTIAELDAIPFVDPQAFSALLVFAIQNGYTDAPPPPPVDDADQDGFTIAQGDCDDQNPQVHPGAQEILFAAAGTADGVDDNCNGLVDEDLCADGDSTFHAALGICGDVAVSHQTPDGRAMAIRGSFGDGYTSTDGEHFVAMSTGYALLPGEPDFAQGMSTTLSPIEAPHPLPEGAMGCSAPDALTVRDLSRIAIDLDVPPNAGGFALDWNFMSAEFPEFTCTTYDDTFLLLVHQNGQVRNVAVDENGLRVSANAAVISDCLETHAPTCTGDESLRGTGFEADIGGGTGWRTTSGQLIPGVPVTLELVLFDEGDAILDSTVLLDHFRWLKTAPSQDGFTASM